MCPETLCARLLSHSRETISLPHSQPYIATRTGSIGSLVGFVDFCTFPPYNQKASKPQLKPNVVYSYLMNQTPGEKLRHGMALRRLWTYPSPVDSCKLLNQSDHTKRNFSPRV